MALVLPTIDATPGAGENLPSGAAKINAAYRQLETQLPVAQATRLIIDGDSIAGALASDSTGSPLFWARSMHPIDYIFDIDTDNFAIGATRTDDIASPEGMTYPPRMLRIANRIKAVRATNERVVVGVQAGTNDVGLAQGDNASPSTLANIQKMLANYFAAGAHFVFIMSIDPRVDSSADIARNVLAVNAGLADLCRLNPDKLMFIDTQFATADGASPLFIPQGGSGQTGAHTDSLHPAARGAYLKSRVLGPALQRILPRRRSLVPPAGSLQSSTAPASLRGNALGPQGRFTDTGAVANQTNGLTGPAGSITGLDQFVSAKLFGQYPNLSGTLTGTQTLDISLQPWPPALEQFGRTDILCTRFRFAGVPTTSDRLSIGIIASRPAAYDIQYMYESEVQLYLASIKGLRGVGYAVTADSNGRNYGGVIAADTNASAVKVMPDITGLLAMSIPTPRKPSALPANVSITTGVTWNANFEFSGDVFILGAYLGQRIPIVAPTA